MPGLTPAFFAQLSFYCLALGFRFLSAAKRVIQPLRLVLILLPLRCERKIYKKLKYERGICIII